jgi:ribosomal protein L19
MNTYTIIEAQNINSVREGTEIKSKNLASAKRFASKAQVFQGTVLKIEQNGRLIAYKDANGWTNS